MNSDARPVAVVTGVGPGTGAATVRRFVVGGYRVAMLARIRAELGTPSVLVHNVVAGARGRFMDIDPPGLRRAPRQLLHAAAAIADEIWHLAHQARSAWTFLHELRPFGETW